MSILETIEAKVEELKKQIEEKGAYIQNLFNSGKQIENTIAFTRHEISTIQGAIEGYMQSSNLIQGKTDVSDAAANTAAGETTSIE